MVAYYYLMNEIKKRFSVKEEITEASYMHQAFDVLMNGIKNKEIGGGKAAFEKGKRV